MSPWQRSQRWFEPPLAAVSCPAAEDLGLFTAKELLTAVVTANGSRQEVAATASALWRLVSASPSSAENCDFEGLRSKVKLVEAELLVRGDISKLAGREFTHASAARAWLCQRIEDEQGSDLADLLGQVRAGVSTLAKARNIAVHGPLRAGKQKGLSPSDASTSQDELSESTAVEEVAVAPYDGGNSGGGTSAAGYSREGSGRDAEVGSSRTATGPWVSSGGQAKHVCQGKGKGTSGCIGKENAEQYHGTVTDEHKHEPEDKFVENMEEAMKAAKEKTAGAEAKASADKVANEECTDTEAAEERAAKQVKDRAKYKKEHRAKYKKGNALVEKALYVNTADAEAKASADKVANERFTDSARVVAVRDSVLARISGIEKQLELSSTSMARGLHLKHLQYLRDRLDHVLEEDEFSAAEADDDDDAAVAAEIAALLAGELAESSDGIVGAFPQLPETRHGVELLAALG